MLGKMTVFSIIFTLHYGIKNLEKDLPPKRCKPKFWNDYFVRRHVNYRRHFILCLKIASYSAFWIDVSNPMGPWGHLFYWVPKGSLCTRGGTCKTHWTLCHIPNFSMEGSVKLSLPPVCHLQNLVISFSCHHGFQSSTCSEVSYHPNLLYEGSSSPQVFTSLTSELTQGLVVYMRYFHQVSAQIVFPEKGQP